MVTKREQKKDLVVPLDEENPTFTFEGNRLVVLKNSDGKSVWLVTEVCRVLGLSNPARVVSTRVDKEYASKVSIREILTNCYVNRGSPTRLVVTEPGLYQIIMSSSKPIAKRFKRWVLEEVLPSAVKTGRYSAHPELDLNRIKIDDIMKIVVNTAIGFGTTQNEMPQLEEKHIPKEWMSVRDAADFVGLSPLTVFQYVKKRHVAARSTKKKQSIYDRTMVYLPEVKSCADYKRQRSITYMECNDIKF